MKNAPRVRGVQGEFDVLGAGPGDLADRLGGGGAQVGRILAGRGCLPLAADEVLVPRCYVNRTSGLARKSG